jgi:hypothetical protein
MFIIVLTYIFVILAAVGFILGMVVGFKEIVLN